MVKRIDPIAGNTSTTIWSTTKKIDVIPPQTFFANSSTCTKNLIMPIIENGGSTYQNVSPDWAIVSPLTIMKWKLFTQDPPKPSFPTTEEAKTKTPSVNSINIHGINRFSPFGCPCERCNLGPVHSGEFGTISATWTGHASFIVTVGGYTILTDPVWSDRCSPTQCAGPKRFVPPPIAIEEIPFVDVVSISHNHYDHLDTETVKYIIRNNHSFGDGKNREKPTTHPIFVVPMGMKKRWFESLVSSVPELDLDFVVELMWWDTANITNTVAATRATLKNSNNKSESSETVLPSNTPNKFTVTAVPVQHWTQRSPIDRNRELWCGFVFSVDVQTSSNEETVSNPTWNTLKIFHSGDTGYYKPLFEQIGEMCGPFDFAMIPIGAYEPRYVMQKQHISPFEAVEIHKDIRSKNSAGMHWGTFILTDEPIDEPPKALAVAMAQSNGVLPETEGALDNDANVTKLKILRKLNFHQKQDKEILFNPTEVPPKNPPEFISLKSEGTQIPFFDCDQPFRALQHGETWNIEAST